MWWMPSSFTTAVRSPLAHESLTRCADERYRLGEEHAHRVPHRRRLLLGRTRDVDALERRAGQLDGRIQGQRRELLPLGLRDRLRLLLGELAQPAHQILRVTTERKSEAA